jgi:hypothetical protein
MGKRERCAGGVVSGDVRVHGTAEEYEWYGFLLYREADYLHMIIHHLHASC